MHYLRSALHIFRKDIVCEMRGKESLSLMLFLSFLLLVIFNFALDINRETVAGLAPGILWIVFAFSGVLGMGRTSMAERDEDAYLGIVFSPAPPESFYLGKALSNLVFLLVMEVLTIAAFAVLFDFERLFTLLPALAPSLLLGTLGFALVGTLFSFISTSTRYGEVLMPLIYFPVVVPVILGGVSSMGLVLEGRVEDTYKWVQMMAVFDVLYFCISILLFEHLLEE